MRGRPHGPGLVDAAGFARSFMDFVASGVIGTLWSVEDQTAHEVAARFYRALSDKRGTPFAEALRQIRADGFTGDGEDTFAAYCFYGDPGLSGGRMKADEDPDM